VLPVKKSESENELLRLDGEIAEQEIIQGEAPLVEDLMRLEAEWLSEVYHTTISPYDSRVQKIVAVILDLEGDAMREETAKDILHHK